MVLANQCEQKLKKFIYKIEILLYVPILNK